MSVAKYSDNFDVHAFELALFHSISTLHALRNIAAFFPDDDVYDLAMHIREFLDEKGIGFDRVMTIVRGRRVHLNTQLADLRMVLNNVNPATNREVQHQITREALQTFGRLLMMGASLAKIERLLRINRKTLYMIDRDLGIRKSRKAEMDRIAADAAEAGMSIKKFMRHSKLPRTPARRRLGDAKRVRNQAVSAP